MGLLNAPSFEDPESSVSTQATATSSVSRAPSTSKSQGKSMATSAPTTKVVTGRVRLSYCNLFKAVLGQNAKEGDIPKFGCTILIPKSDEVTLKKLRDAAEVAIAAKWPKRPPKIATTLHDGDQPKESNGEPYGEECKGHWVMAVQSKFKPQVVDASDGNEVIQDGYVVSGDYAKVSLNAYGYDFSGKRGVSFGLNNVLFLEKGESLGGRTNAFSDFADDLPQQ